MLFNVAVFNLFWLLCFVLILHQSFIFLFVQHDRLDWPSCIAWTKMKNLCHSKMVIYIENVLSLNGANFQYKFSDYPKGF